MKIDLKSVISDKIEIRDSKIHKKGMFAKRPIKKDEIVFIKGGHIIKREQIFSSEIINSYHPISDDYYIGAVKADEEERVKLYENHSCDPNCGLREEITFIAIRDIEIDEELTIDYAFLDNEDYSFKCNCGTVNCRKIITGRDWKLEEIQKRYFNYFAAYLKKKIEK